LLGVWVKLSAGCQLPEREGLVKVVARTQVENLLSWQNMAKGEANKIKVESDSWQNMAKGEANKIKVESEGCSYSVSRCQAYASP